LAFGKMLDDGLPRSGLVHSPKSVRGNRPKIEARGGGHVPLFFLKNKAQVAGIKEGELMKFAPAR